MPFFRRLLQSNRVIYVRTVTPKFFDRSHSRNMMFRLAGGDIICNIDADIFAGKNYASFVNSKFSSLPNIFLRTANYNDLCGKFAVFKKDFEAVTGYDESMTSYGYEDIDLYTRLKMLDRKPTFIKDPEFSKFISHQIEERTKNEFLANSLKQLYITFNATEKQTIFLMKDGNFEYGTLIPHNDASGIPVALKEDAWRKGKWSHPDNDILMLDFNDGDCLKLTCSFGGKVLNEDTVSPDRRYFLMDNPTFLRNTLYVHPMLANKARYDANVSGNRTAVNQNGFGKGEVFINFNDTPTLV